MKRVFGFLILSMAILMVGIPVFAQTPDACSSDDSVCAYGPENEGRPFDSVILVDVAEDGSESFAGSIITVNGSAGAGSVSGITCTFDGTDVTGCGPDELFDWQEGFTLDPSKGDCSIFHPTNEFSYASEDCPREIEALGECTVIGAESAIWELTGGSAQLIVLECTGPEGKVRRVKVRRGGSDNTEVIVEVPPFGNSWNCWGGYNDNEFALICYYPETQVIMATYGEGETGLYGAEMILSQFTKGDSVENQKLTLSWLDLDEEAPYSQYQVNVEGWNFAPGIRIRPDGSIEWRTEEIDPAG